MKHLNDDQTVEETNQLSTPLAMKTGIKPYISEKRMEANRWQLKRNLNSMASRNDFFLSRFFSTVISNKMQVASMVITFTLGYIFASTPQFNHQKESALQNQLVENKIVLNKTSSSNVLTDNEQIINLEVSHKNSNQFDVSYTSLNHSNFQANMNNDETVSLLTLAMKNNLNDATRLELVEILKEHLENNKIRESLSNSLLNDPNPGVRIVAAESLSKLANNQKIRTTLRKALSNDINQGVRVSVFEGLIQHLDDYETIELFETKALTDSNYYIRNETKNILEKIQQKKQSQINTI